MNNQEFLINLLFQPNFGVRGINKILNQSDSYEDFKGNIENLFLENSRSLSEFPAEINKIIKRSDQSQIELIDYFHKDYPNLLRQIPDSPLIIACKGNVELLKEKCISIVGTRNLSAYGNQVTKELCKFLNTQNITTVSGMAFGVDKLVHMNSTKTIAVLPTFPSKAIPANNQSVYQDILNNNGLILSDNLTDLEPAPYMYVSRNRIIAALSNTTIVTEAGEKSGALITAQYALDYDREVYAVPGNIFSEKSIGCNNLISSNVAKILNNFKDLFEETYTDKPLQIANKDLGLTEVEQRIYDAISDKPVNIDDLSIQTGLSVSVLGYSLINLELKDLVQKDILNNYIRN